MSVHVSFQYPCNQCKYKATEKGHLEAHKMFNSSYVNSKQYQKAVLKPILCQYMRMSSIIVIKVYTNNIQVAFIVSNHLPILWLFQELTNCIRNKIEM